MKIARMLGAFGLLLLFAAISMGAGNSPQIGVGGVIGTGDSVGPQSVPGFAPTQRGSVGAPYEYPSWSSATYALSLDGVDDYAVSGVNVPAGTGTITMLSWYYDAAPTSTLSVVAAYSGLGYNLGYPDAAKGWVGDNNWIQVFLPTRGTSWKHGAVVRYSNTIPASYSIYIDGEPVSKSSGGQGENTPHGLSPEKIYAGRNAGYTWQFKGKIAELAIFNISLTQAQIQDYYLKRLTGTEPGLVRLFHCDEGAGTTCADACGSGDVLTLTNGATWTTRL